MTIERVAEAIRAKLVNEYSYEVATTENFDGADEAVKNGEIVLALNDALVPVTELASAAIDAICEGLSWRSDRRNELSFKGLDVGFVMASAKGGCVWRFGCGTAARSGVSQTEDEARDKLMTVARAWLRGEVAAKPTVGVQS